MFRQRLVRAGVSSRFELENVYACNNQILLIMRAKPRAFDSKLTLCSSRSQSKQHVVGIITSDASLHNCLPLLRFSHIASLVLSLSRKEKYSCTNMYFRYKFMLCSRSPISRRSSGPPASGGTLPRHRGSSWYWHSTSVHCIYCSNGVAFACWLGETSAGELEELLARRWDAVYWAAVLRWVEDSQF